jgi:hypothetical protein
MSCQALLFPESLPLLRTLTVSQDIAALELLPTHRGSHSGRITPVPKGARFEVCGPGFTERTIQVRWEGRLCFVFLQDVELVPSAHPSGQDRAALASDLMIA